MPQVWRPSLDIRLTPNTRLYARILGKKSHMAFHGNIIFGVRTIWLWVKMRTQNGTLVNGTKS